jgi:hypothetical protein
MTVTSLLWASFTSVTEVNCGSESMSYLLRPPDFESLPLGLLHLVLVSCTALTE